MKDGWIKLYRKSVDSQVFRNERLWKLWCLCLLKANHKPEYVPIDGIVEPIRVEPGQFITGRYELHADYHQRRRGYKKRSPSPFTVWRWLLSLRDMQNLSIKSFNKYSIISISNWKLYQENEQQMSNRRATDEHKQERIRNNNMLNQWFERFWSEYPRKVGKKKAREKFLRLSLDELKFKKMIEALRTQKESFQWKRDGGQYIPHPATWIHG
ncbi:MAG: hypothetical protein GTN76_02710, partial [Candidatus Aenigmarchaeota archaeon]|nr:hypothetical protein [Candidatus Aenigmarchaeota archaeon]